MARVTTEDCITSISNRFELVIYSCRRARELLSGNEANVAIDNDKPTVIALREIADKKIDLGKIWENIISVTKLVMCIDYFQSFFRKKFKCF